MALLHSFTTSFGWFSCFNTLPYGVAKNYNNKKKCSSTGAESERLLNESLMHSLLEMINAHNFYHSRLSQVTYYWFTWCTFLPCHPMIWYYHVRNGSSTDFIINFWHYNLILSFFSHVSFSVLSFFFFFYPALHKMGKHMEDSIVAAYVALLVGCTIQGSEVREGYIIKWWQHLQIDRL